MIITCETVARANLDVATTPVPVNENRTDRRLVWVTDREAGEPVRVHQLRSRLSRVVRFWIRINGARIDQGEFDVTPAKTFRMRVGALFRH